MQALRVLVVVMGVMIVAGTVALGVVLAQRMGGGGAAAREWSLALDEPAGTQVAAAAASGDGLALTLRGGGPERVVVLDARTGRVLGRISVSK
jgi:hypothetical protein